MVGVEARKDAVFLTDGAEEGVELANRPPPPDLNPDEVSSLNDGLFIYKLHRSLKAETKSCVFTGLSPRLDHLYCTNCVCTNTNLSSVVKLYNCFQL